MSILICGGAGYIGSHTVHQLVGGGEEVVIVDNLLTGHRSALNPAVTQINRLCAQFLRR